MDLKRLFLLDCSVIIKISLVVVILVVSFAIWLYRLALVPNFNIKDTVYVYVDEKRDFEDLCIQLRDSALCKDLDGFKYLASLFQYHDAMKTGRYAVSSSMGNYELLNNLRKGLQSTTRVTFNNVRTKVDLAERLDSQLMLSKDDLLSLLNDSAYCDSLGFNQETIVTLFIPNTYEMYWNMSAESFVKRMKREYDAFWTSDRLEKANAIGLTPVEVSVLASIVEEETAAVDEFPVVAGLYINRLKAGVHLQADPTVKFAIGDLALRRVLFEHLKVNSPYNTYKHLGLPPGPLRIPSIKGLNGVLHHMKHKYMYMCAKEDFSGRHNFAISLAEHNRNANRYRTELNRRRIR